jgi:hypothetical protein
MIVSYQDIQNKIFTIRAMQVMMDRDLALLFGVENRVLNQAVKRNIKRFPDDFMFQLSKDEFEDWKSQIVTSNSDKMGLRKMPYVFTEQGVSMLSSILRSDTAVETSIHIVRAFIQMRKFLSQNANIFTRLEKVEQKILTHDDNFDKVFKAIESKEIKPKQGIFYDGQVFDAYSFVSDIVREAKNSIVLIDNYCDDSVLTLFSKNQNIEITIYTKNISKQLLLDLEKYNAQYKEIKINKFQDAHDRFMIIDKKEVYHIGASLKDLGKKWFAFSKLDIKNLNILEKLESSK